MHVNDWLESRRARRRTLWALVLSIVITVALYAIPFGQFAAYPLMLLSTLVHELGHGLTALTVGAQFDALAIYSDGSGIAHYQGQLSPRAHALVAAGGLVGPALGAAAGFIMGRNAKAARVATSLSSAALLLLLSLFIRNPFGIAFVGLFALGLGWVAVRKDSAASQLVVVFGSVQLALSVFSRSDYLFTDVAHTGAGTLPSDTAHIAQALGGPYWAWGMACGGFSLAVLALGVWLFTRVLREHGTLPNSGALSSAGA
jgi:hypothetical protein